MFYVYSTLSADTSFPVYIKTHDLPLIEKHIIIKGGTGVKVKDQLVTPKGVVTEVSDEDMAQLKKMFAFNKQVEDGFIVVEEKKVAVEKVVKNMTEKDGGAQKTEEDFVKEGAKPAKK